MPMEHHNALVLRVSRAVPLSETSVKPMNIVLQRPYAHLLNDFQKMYVGDENVIVKVDGRYGDRRKEARLVLQNLRSSDRRKPVQKDWQMNLIVQRPFAQLTNDLEKVFKGQPDVNVIIDARHHERRKKTEKTIRGDRRVADRRKRSETLVEVVISA